MRRYDVLTPEAPRLFPHKPPRRKNSAVRRGRLVKCALLLAMILILAGCAPMTGVEETNAPFNGIFGDRADTIDITIALTVLSVLPGILIMLTSFTRIIIVLSFVKQAIGTAQMPPTQVIIGLALFLTYFIMRPVFDDMRLNAYEPYIAGEINIEEAADRAVVPLRGFMLRQIRQEDLQVFVRLSGAEAPQPLEEIGMEVIIPAFLTSEIKRAFGMGFLMYIPFIVIDMVVASVLMAMGMMMLPPVVISMPFKILIFVVVDGWLKIVETLVISFRMTG